jgi:proline dehydrogenase
LRRSEADVEWLVGLGARVRLVKGAYAEPPAVAFPHKRDVDANFARLADRLLRAGVYPAIATHDERLIEGARRTTAAEGIGPDRFEFQMLYGVRRDLQMRLHREGYRVRVYVPFGEEWYPYFMRRLAERPANLMFVVKSVLRDRSSPSAPLQKCHRLPVSKLKVSRTKSGDSRRLNVSGPRAEGGGEVLSSRMSW